MSVVAATLEQRDRQPEVMDQPGLSPELHAQALASLRRINRLSCVARSVWRPIRALLREPDALIAPRILDVACGGGDIALELARRAARGSIRAHVAGCDRSAFAIDFARRAAARDRRPDVEFFECDVLNADLPADYDVITCTLFLHHLDDNDTQRLLSNMARAARRLVVVSDLRRTRLGYLLARLACTLCTRSPVVRVDGPLSVAAAFTSREAQKLAEQSGMSGARIVHEWPERYLLIWSRR
ncbi:MAG: methyltransferase domain-containing protein [Planctomycetaceae bacterium]